MTDPVLTAVDLIHAYAAMHYVNWAHLDGANFDAEKVADAALAEFLQDQPGTASEATRIRGMMLAVIQDQHTETGGRL